MSEARREASGSAGKSLLAWVAILGLLAIVAYLVSERNARSWYLVPQEGRLVVLRGMMLPMGRTEFQSSNPDLAKAYAPVVAPPGKSLPEEQTFQDSSSLDQALYGQLAAWAREDVASGDPSRLDRGLSYIGRALLLPGISAQQRTDLTALQAESGYHEARRLVETARAQLAQAAEKLRATAASPASPHATDAQLLLRDLGPALDATSTAARAAADAARRDAPVAPPAPAAAPAAAGQ